MIRVPKAHSDYGIEIGLEVGRPEVRAATSPPSPAEP